MADHSFLRLELFGGPALLRSGEPESTSPFQAALLTLLLAEGRERLPRSKVQSLLWPAPSGPKVRHRLSQLIYQVNQKVGRRLVEADGEVVRVFQGVVGCDLDDFEEFIRRPDFRAAGDLIRRGFLSAFPAPPTEAFHDWMSLRHLSVRSRLREKALGSWAAAEAAQDWTLGRSAAEALLLLDPDDEAVLRRVMRARAMGGMVREAEAVYLAFADRRGGPDDWQPQDQTVELLRSVRATFQRPEPPAEVTVPPSLEVPLCGRDEELAYLTRSVFQSRPGGRRSTVVISGEAGLGKTRLVEEAIQGARFRGYRVLRARPAELERNIPLNPLVEALAHPWVGEVLRSLEDPWRSVLLSLMPQFHEGPGPLPEVPYVQPGSLPRRTYEAFFRLFRAAADRSKILLFIDDAQWADETSAAVLQFMHRRWPKGDLALLLTYRREELDREDVLGRFLEELESDAQVVSIRLSELEEGASRRLAQSVASERLSDEALEEVVTLAGGNPFFLIELTADYVADRTPERRVDGVLLPFSVRHMITRRIRELDTVAKQVVAALSVFVHPASLGRLTRMTGVAREECVVGLETLQNLRLVEWVDGGVRCRHDLVRCAVYDDLSQPRRALLHGRIAEMLESESSDPPKDQLALHYYRAGESELALKYALGAADEAEASGSNSEGIRYTKMARTLTRDQDERATLTRNLAQLHYRDRDLDGAEEWLEAAVRDMRSASSRSVALELESQLLEVQAEAGSIEASEALDRLRSLEREAVTEGHNAALPSILERQLRVFDRVGWLEQIDELFQKAEGRLGHGEPQSECALHCMLALKLFFGDPLEALAHGRRAVELASRSEVAALKLRAFNRYIMLLSQSGQLHGDEGRRVVRQAVAYSKNSGDVLERYLIRANVAVWYLDTGQLERARTSFERLSAEADKSKARRPRFELTVNLGELALHEAALDRAHAHFRDAVTLLHDRTPFYARGFAYSGLGLSLLRLGQLRASIDVRDRIGEPPKVWQSDQAIWVTFLSELAVRHRAWDEADDRIASHEVAIASRLPVLWIKLRLERLRLLRRSPQRNLMVPLAEEGRDLAARLGLEVRQRQFERMLQVR